MNQISFAQDIQPLSTFRSNVSGFINQVQSTHRPLIITNHGRSAAVLLDVVMYDKLMEQLALLQDIQMAERQIVDGNGVNHEDALAQVLAGIAV
jgi:prevent-host-death family protein